MKLLLDHDILEKADKGSATLGKDTELEDQTSLEYDSSYSRRYEGVAAGEAYDPDDPDVGKEWREGESNLEDVDSERESRETQKSISILQDFNKSLESYKKERLPSQRELEFLVNEMGYRQEDVIKGQVLIKGRLRTLFNDWLCSRLVKSVDDLLPRR